jgi:hypothetical protein
MRGEDRERCGAQLPVFFFGPALTRCGAAPIKCAMIYRTNSKRRFRAGTLPRLR